MRHILVGHTNISFCERLNFNTFMRTFLNFTIVILTWYDFTSYSIVLPMSISAQVFYVLSIYCGFIIYVTTVITYTGFGIIALWPSTGFFPYPPVCYIIGIVFLLFVVNFHQGHGTYVHYNTVSVM